MPAEPATRPVTSPPGTPPDPAADPRLEDMQQAFVAFVRAFGLLRPEQTPCGAAIPVSEAHALTVLHDEGPVTQTHLAHRLELTKSTVSRLVDQLEVRGWALRQPGDRDARQRLVELTPDGRDRAEQISRLRRSRLARLVGGIPEDRRAEVLAALDTLAEAARETRDL